MNSPTTGELAVLRITHTMTVKQMADAALVSVPTMTRYISGASAMHPYVFRVFKIKIRKFKNAKNNEAKQKVIKDFLKYISRSKNFKNRRY